MNEVFIDVRNLGIEKYFTTDIVSIDQLIGCIEDLECEIGILKEKIEELKNPSEPDAYDTWHDRKMCE